MDKCGTPFALSFVIVTSSYHWQTRGKLEVVYQLDFDQRVIAILVQVSDLLLMHLHHSKEELARQAQGQGRFRIYDGICAQKWAPSTLHLYHLCHFFQVRLFSPLKDGYKIGK